MRFKDLWFVTVLSIVKIWLKLAFQRELNVETSAVRDKQQDLQDKQRANAAESSRWRREIERVNAEYVIPTPFSL